MNKTRIVCYGDSNTWGYCAATGNRYDDDQRWVPMLQQLLGDQYSVLEEGLSGRTTVFDDPLFPALNGLAHLPAIAMSHAPIDLLVVMLGTNDCKERFSVNSQNIADGLRRLVNEAKRMDIWRDEPKILIIAPMIIDKAVYQVPRIGQEMGERCAEKSRQLPALMRETARETGSWFMDCNPFVRPGPADWMHFDADSNPTFARALASMVKRIFTHPELLEDSWC